jgi:hypothetical protein
MARAMTETAHKHNTTIDVTSHDLGRCRDVGWKTGGVMRVSGVPAEMEGERVIACASLRAEVSSCPAMRVFTRASDTVSSFVGIEGRVAVASCGDSDAVGAPGRARARST